MPENCVIVAIIDCNIKETGNKLRVSISNDVCEKLKWESMDKISLKTLNDNKTLVLKKNKTGDKCSSLCKTKYIRDISRNVIFEIDWELDKKYLGLTEVDYAINENVLEIYL